MSETKNFEVITAAAERLSVSPGRSYRTWSREEKDRIVGETFAPGAGDYGRTYWFLDWVPWRMDRLIMAIRPDALPTDPAACRAARRIINQPVLLAQWKPPATTD